MSTMGSTLQIAIAMSSQATGLVFNADGNVALANSVNGITITNSNNTTIGGSVAGAGNVIAGHTSVAASSGNGIFVTGTSNATRISGNYVGLNAAGTAPIPNRVGVFLYQAQRTRSSVQMQTESVIRKNAMWLVVTRKQISRLSPATTAWSRETTSAAMPRELPATSPPRAMSSLRVRREILSALKGQAILRHNATTSCVEGSR